MTPQKRAFDVILALTVGAILLPVFCVAVLLLLVTEGRPIFYISERMRTSDRSFRLIKLRTMRGSIENGGVTGGDKSDRISRFQGLLRRSRADEFPQLWNVLRGDMSFVGPRPPLRMYTEAFPVLYANVLRSRPGITGPTGMVGG